jgi:hypothetical protein
MGRVFGLNGPLQKMAQLPSLPALSRVLAVKLEKNLII